MLPEPRAYRFGPRSKRGLVVGLRAGQILVAVVGTLLAMATLRVAPGATGALAAFLVLALSGLAAFWPIAGRTTEEWAPVILRWTADGLPGRRRCFPSQDRSTCLGGCTVDQASVEASPRGRARSARGTPFAHLQILGARRPDDPAQPVVGVVHDRRHDLFTAVLKLRGVNFSLLSAEDQEAAVTRWSSVLAGLARESSALRRVQWSVQTLPDDGSDLRRHLRTAAELPPDSAAYRSYDDILTAAMPSTPAHEVFFSLQVSRQRAGRRGGGATKDAVALLLDETRALRQQLRQADVDVEALLGPGDLVGLIRRLGSAAAGRVGSAQRPCPPCAIGRPWPAAVRADWAHVQADGAWHTTYWISEWPRTDVDAQFLAPTLLSSSRRTVSVVMEPVPPTRTVRGAERDRTADIADAEIRRRGGFLETARRSREAANSSQREAELAEGHALFRYSGYVTVTSDSLEDLDDRRREVEQSAARSQIDLCLLYGDQLRALGCSLPFCLGLA